MIDKCDDLTVKDIVLSNQYLQPNQKVWNFNLRSNNWQTNEADELWVTGRKKLEVVKKNFMSMCWQKILLWKQKYQEGKKKCIRRENLIYTKNSKKTCCNRY